jgi:YVTN family beta-propeller protein
VSGTVSLSATASDNVGVTAVQFFVDNSTTALGTDSTSPYSASWNTTTVSNGVHTVKAVASDAAGNTTTSTVNVSVANPDTAAPSVSLTGPVNGATVSGTVSLSATASDNVGVTAVQFFVDNSTTALGTDSTSPYSASWNSTTVNNGAHTLRAVARDAAGNTTTSTIAVTVANSVSPPVDHPPTAPEFQYFYATDSVTGEVRGRVVVSDADGDPLTYQLLWGPSGASSFSFNNSTGDFSYIPSEEMRQNATLYPENNYDTFRVTISDGTASVSPWINMQVLSTNVAPYAFSLPEVQPADPVTGRVSGSMNLFDPNDDPIVYSINSGPARGMATINAAGIYTYSPYASERSAGGLDSFTVSATDGKDTSTYTVTVPVRVGELASTQTQISLPGSGTNIAVSGSRAYVFNKYLWTVTAIDTSTNTVIRTSQPLASGSTLSYPGNVAVSPDGNRLFVANWVEGKIIELNPDTLAPVGQPIAVTGGGDDMIFSPDGGRLYVAHDGASATLSIIDTNSRAVIGTVPTTPDTTDMAISSDGRTLYLADGYYNRVQVIDTSAKAVAYIPLGPQSYNSNPAGIALSPDGRWAYVTDSQNATVRVIDMAARTVVGEPISVGVPSWQATTSWPTGIAISPDGNRIYVANGQDIMVLDTATRTVIGAVRFPGYMSDSSARASQAISVDSNGDVLAYGGNGLVSMSIGPSAEPQQSGQMMVTLAAPSSTLTASSTSRVTSSSLFLRDSTKPAVSLSAPGGGGPVSGTVQLSASASDNVGVTDVKFYVDNSTTALGTAAASPYSSSWNTTAVTNGTHTVKAVARDAAGNTATSTRTVTVDNAKPSVSLTGPANGATVSGTVSLSATASDNAGVTGVKFLVDGAVVGAEDTTSPYGVSWNTTLVSNGMHTVTAVARDAAGNSTTTSTRTVTVANPDITAPSVSVTAPNNGAPVAGTVSLSATASDNVGVADVKFYVDNSSTALAIDTTSPYGASWNTTTVANGAHTVTARARDAAGNISDSTVSVTVDNTVSTIPVTVTAIPVNTYPTAVAFSGNNAFVYGGDVIWTIDTRSNTITDSTALYNEPPVVSPDGKRRYEAGYMSVQVIDNQTNAVLDTIEIPNCDECGYGYSAGLQELVVSPDGKRLYARHAYVLDYTVLSSVTVIDTHTNEIIKTTGPIYAKDIEIAVDGRVFAVDEDFYYADVNVYDENMELLDTIRLTSHAGSPWSSPTTFAISTDRRYAYAHVYDPDSGGMTVSIIDTDPDSPIYLTETYMTERYSAVSLDGTRLYVPETDGKTISVYDTATNVKVGSFVTDQQASTGPRGLYFAPNGTLYIADPGDNTVYAVTIGGPQAL